MQTLFPVSITDVVFIFIYVRFIKLIVVITEEVAFMVKIGILANAQNFTAKIAFMITGIEILARANSFSASGIIAIMIAIIIDAIQN